MTDKEIYESGRTAFITGSCPVRLLNKWHQIKSDKNIPPFEIAQLRLFAGRTWQKGWEDEKNNIPDNGIYGKEINGTTT